MYIIHKQCNILLQEESSRNKREREKNVRTGSRMAFSLKRSSQLHLVIVNIIYIKKGLDLFHLSHIVHLCFPQQFVLNPSALFSLIIQ